MAKVTVKRGPAQKSVHKTDTNDKVSTTPQNAGPSGLVETVDENTPDDGVIEQSDNAEVTEPTLILPDDIDDTDISDLQDSTTNKSTTVRKSGKAGKIAISASKVPVDPYLGFTLLIEDGKALKMSPKTQNHVFFELGLKLDDNALYLRMKGNEGGGLHSKEWLALTPIFDVIEKHQGQSFKSTVFNPLFKGSSANNAGFLGAVLRSSRLGLLKPSEIALYQHQVPADYIARKAALTVLLGQ